MYVIQYDDGLFNCSLGFPVKLDEATRYPTLKEAEEEMECLMYGAKIIIDPSIKESEVATGN
jgi:hypothetical protein